MDVFLREFTVPATMPEKPMELVFDVSSSSAYLDTVWMRREYEADGSVSGELVHLVVRDKGHVTKTAYELSVWVVSRLNELIPLPDDCGKCLGYLQSNAGHFACYVFASRSSPRAIRSSSGGTISPPRARVSSIVARRPAESACACVTSGPTHHEPESQTSLRTVAAIEQQDDWEFPDELPASVG